MSASRRRHSEQLPLQRPLVADEVEVPNATERITNEFTNFIARLSTSNRTIIINNNRWWERAALLICFLDNWQERVPVSYAVCRSKSVTYRFPSSRAHPVPVLGRWVELHPDLPLPRPGTDRNQPTESLKILELDSESALDVIQLPYAPQWMNQHPWPTTAMFPLLTTIPPECWSTTGPSTDIHQVLDRIVKPRQRPVRVLFLCQ